MKPKEGSADYFEVTEAEITRAQMGFSIETGSIPDDLENAYERALHKSTAAMVVAGNIALLDHLPEDLKSVEIAELRSATQATIESGVALAGLAAQANVAKVSNV